MSRKIAEKLFCPACWRFRFGWHLVFRFMGVCDGKNIAP